MSEHTKTPWYAGNFEYPNAEIVDGAGRPMFTMTDVRTSPEEFRLNIKHVLGACNSHAQLQAQAKSQPALLAACERASNLFGQHITNQLPPPFVEWALKVKDECEAAIEATREE